MTGNLRVVTGTLLIGITIAGSTRCGGAEIKDTSDHAQLAESRSDTSMPVRERHPVVFGAFAESQEQLEHIVLLAESIRSFAGRHAEAPIWAYLPHGSLQVEDETFLRLRELHAEIHRSSAPEAALQFYFAKKVFAASEAEERAERNAEILVWMDDDTVILKEPEGILLDNETLLGYRPVTHKNIGSLYSEPADSFWARVYELLDVPKTAMFSMETPADRMAIRPYFNAGLLVVRPEAGILREWAESFPVLYKDPILVGMCQRDILKRIFLHQAALAGAILTTVEQEQIVELPATFNYPLFFHDRYESEKTFESVEGIVSLRYDVYFRDPEPDWKERLTGPPEIVQWLQDRLGR